MKSKYQYNKYKKMIRCDRDKKMNSARHDSQVKRQLSLSFDLIPLERVGTLFYMLEKSIYIHVLEKLTIATRVGEISRTKKCSFRAESVVYLRTDICFRCLLIEP